MCVSVKLFPEEISISIIRLSKDLPAPVWVSVIHSVQSPNRRKGQKGKFSLSLSLSWDLCLPLPLGIRPCDFAAFGLRHYTSRAPVLRPSALGWIILLLAFLVLQLADGRLLDFFAFIATWANSCNRYPLIQGYISMSIFIYLIKSFSLDDSNIYFFSFPYCTLWERESLYKAHI